MAIACTMQNGGFSILGRVWFPLRLVLSRFSMGSIADAFATADFANAAIVAALAATDATEIKAHHRKAQLLEGLVHRIGDAVIHRPAMHWVRVHDQREWSAGFLGVVVTTLKPAVWAGEHDFRHGVPKSDSCLPATSSGSGRVYKRAYHAHPRIALGSTRRRTNLILAKPKLAIAYHINQRANLMSPLPRMTIGIP